MIAHIIQEVRKHAIDYLVLASGSALFLLYLRIFQGERLESFLTLLIFASFYTMWGIVHHTRNNTLHMKNVLEYIAVSFLMLVLVSLFYMLI